MSGIYFLIKDGTVIYIGQSTQPERRLLQHRDKDFDSFRIIKMPCLKTFGVRKETNKAV